VNGGYVVVELSAKMWRVVLPCNVAPQLNQMALQSQARHTALPVQARWYRPASEQPITRQFSI